jgi:hypothetical protein
MSMHGRAFGKTCSPAPDTCKHMGATRHRQRIFAFDQLAVTESQKCFAIRIMSDA